MEEGSYFFSANRGDDTELLLAPLTDETATAAGLDPDQASGYFLYETSLRDPNKITILAQVPSDEAAFALSRMLGMK